MVYWMPAVRTYTQMLIKSKKLYKKAGWDKIITSIGLSVICDTRKQTRTPTDDSGEILVLFVGCWPIGMDGCWDKTNKAYMGPGRLSFCGLLCFFAFIALLGSTSNPVRLYTSRAISAKKHHNALQ